VSWDPAGRCELEVPTPRGGAPRRAAGPAAARRQAATGAGRRSSGRVASPWPWRGRAPGALRVPRAAPGRQQGRAPELPRAGSTPGPGRGLGPASLPPHLAGLGVTLSCPAQPLAGRGAADQAGIPGSSRPGLSRVPQKMSPARPPEPRPARAHP
jgi:hypothetical protein